MEKVVAYIEENKDAFMKGELKRPSQYEKKMKPVYEWFKNHKDNDKQKDKLFHNLKDKFEMTREEFDENLKPLFVFRNSFNEVLQGMEDMALSDNRGNLKDDADL